MAKLTYQEKKRMRSGSFAIPETRQYPIRDIEHGRNALSRVSQHGTPAEIKRVRKAVKARYPDIDMSTVKVNIVPAKIAVVRIPRLGQRGHPGTAPRRKRRL